MCHFLQHLKLKKERLSIFCIHSGYIVKRFAKVKTALGFGEEYGLYSFRHSAIANLQENLEQLGFS